MPEGKKKRGDADRGLFGRELNEIDLLQRTFGISRQAAVGALRAAGPDKTEVEAYINQRKKAGGYAGGSRASWASSMELRMAGKLVAAARLVAAQFALAAEVQTKAAWPVNLIALLPPPGSVDLLGHFLAGQLSSAQTQQFVIETKKAQDNGSASVT